MFLGVCPTEDVLGIFSFSTLSRRGVIELCATYQNSMLHIVQNSNSQLRHVFESIDESQ